MPFQQSMFDSNATFIRPPLVGVTGAGKPPFRKSLLLVPPVVPAGAVPVPPPPLVVVLELELPHAATSAATPTTSIVGTSFFLMTLLPAWSLVVCRSTQPSLAATAPP